MLLGGGGLATGLFVEPGPGVVLPGGQGFATVAEVPGVDEVAGVVEVDPTPLLVVALPVPVVDELMLVDGVVPVLAVLPGVDVELVELPILPLLEGVQGAVVVVVPDWPV